MRLELQNIITDDGTKISYVDVGNGRPLVYINGFGEDVASAHHLIENWSQNFRCMTYDHRGFGKSELSPSIGVERSAQDLHMLLETLDLKDVSLVGYSMGGSVAFSYVEQFGTSRLGRLVLADTAPKLINENDWHIGLWQGRYTREDFIRDLKTIVDNPTLFHLSFYARAATKSLYNSIVTCFPDYDDVKGWFSRVADLTKIRESLLKRIFTCNFSDEKKNGERRYWETMTGGDWRHVLKSIKIPTLCLYASPGSFYYSATAEYMADQIPNAQIEAIENASHVCPKENFAEFTNKIANFCLRRG